MLATAWIEREKGLPIFSGPRDGRLRTKLRHQLHHNLNYTDSTLNLKTILYQTNEAAGLGCGFLSTRKIDCITVATGSSMFNLPHCQ